MEGPQQPEAKDLFDAFDELDPAFLNELVGQAQDEGREKKSRYKDFVSVITIQRRFHSREGKDAVEKEEDEDASEFTESSEESSDEEEPVRFACSYSVSSALTRFHVAELTQSKEGCCSSRAQGHQISFPLCFGRV